MDKLIEIKGSYYTDNNVVIFDNVNAEFYAGERLAIIGPLGSGKTQLLKLLIGLNKPNKGNVYLFGNDTETLKRIELDRLRRKIGVIFDDAPVISNLKVIENVMLPLQYHTNLPDDNIMKRANLLLEYVGYKGDIWGLPGQLPAHIKKGIAVARAMALNPSIMIYDRLFKGLDTYQISQLIGLAEKFHKLQNSRLSIIIANDDRDIRDMKIDRILRIENRKLVQ